MIDIISMRLVWKEFREGWPVILAFLLLPAIVFPMCRPFSQSDFACAMVSTVMFAVPFSAVLWASEKRKLVKQGRDVLEAVLPVTPTQEWVCSYILPALVVGTCGAFMHMLHSITPMEVYGSYTTHISAGYALVAGFLVTGSAFMLSLFLSKTVSHLLGILAGTLWILATSPPIDFNAKASIEVVLVTIILIPAALGINELRKYNSRFTKSFGWTVLVVIFMITAHAGIVDVINSLQSSIVTFGNNSADFNLYFPDRTRISATHNVDLISLDDGVGSNISPQDKDMRLKTSVEFPPTSIAVAYDIYRRVYVFTQRPGDDVITISLWDTTSGTIKEISKMSGRGIIKVDELINTDKYHQWITQPGVADPAGENLLLYTPSRIGNGYDLWLIDISSGEYRMLIMNHHSSWRKYVWDEDKIYLVGDSKPMEVDTVTARVRPLIYERSLR
jgi:hypothetical protein